MLSLTVFFLFLLAPKIINAAATNTPATILGDGFQPETHHVTTPDGYILEIHRIPFARFQNTASGNGPRPVVFLMHGMFASSFVYVTIGPELSIAYNLADAGFDVWMGNHRGTKASRRHETLDPDDRSEKMQFFDFSWDEVATIDMPVMIDYVLNYTGRDQLHYVGHSQGGTSFLAMASVRTEYNEKIASAHLLAGVGNMNYFPDPALTALAQLTDTIFFAARIAGLIEMFPPNTTELIGRKSDNRDPMDACVGDVKYKDLCELIGVRQYVMLRSDDDEEFFENNALGGGSLKQLAHYGQNIRDRSFRRWNYGSNAQNTQVYGTADPPVYDLTLITINTTMHYSLNDTLLDERDVLDMAEVMPNTVARKVERDSFDHMDYVYGADGKELVTDYVIEGILYVERTLNDEADNNGEEDITEVDVDPVDTGLTDSANSLAMSSVMLALLICNYLLV